MEAVVIPFSAEQSVSPYQQMKRQSRRPKTQYLSPTTVHGGLPNFPPPSVAFYSHQKQQYLYNHYHHRQQQQPPILPLPHRSYPPTTQVPSSGHQKGIKSRDQSLTPKKSKSIKRSREPMVDDKKSPAGTMAELLIVDSTNRLGPEPSHVPKDVWRVLGLASPPACEGKKMSLGSGVVEKEKEMEFSGSAFSVSPPPSSVPLPKFPLRRKLSCNVVVEAPGVDAGATDNLRRLLRLR